VSTLTATYVDGYLPDHGDDDADLSSHDSFTSGVPHATFTRLRREDPVHWTPEADGPASGRSPATTTPWP